jgi:hypothetical protein
MIGSWKLQKIWTNGGDERSWRIVRSKRSDFRVIVPDYPFSGLGVV